MAEGIELPSGIVTFLFTDVEGSTRLWGDDRAGMSASLGLHDGIVRTVIESAGGYVFSTAGDSFAAVFSRASDAVAAARQAQAELAQAAWPGPVLGVRMGLHLGEAEERGADYFGSTVNTAARVASAGHGGQVLLTEPVRATALVEAVDLGAHQLRDVAEPVRLFQLGDAPFPPLRVVNSGLSNLPRRPTRLIGRGEQLSQVRQLLLANRLVTITGTGGAGKTRVAIAVGEDELAHRPGGVWFVDLRAVTTDREVPATIAKAVGLTLRDGDSFDQILTFLADKPALVILDNCEHVLDGCAQFADRFLTTTGSAGLLATSREALAVDGEQIVMLGALSSEGADPPAVRLFADRAAAVAPSFAVDETNAGVVTELCRHLDGMPLAIELAAARVTVMTPAELLEGLHDRLSLLSTGRGRPRSRTLEAALDWSYQLLTTHEQRVLRASGVFVDGFDLDAVAAVADLHRTEALTIVEALVAKSLVVRVDHGNRARFGLLETVKAYAEHRLLDAGETTAIRDRHLEHFHRESTVHGRTGFAEIRLGIRLRPDRSNLTAAFEWAASCDRWITAGELIAGCHAAYVLDGGALEARALFERALHGVEPEDPDLADHLRIALNMCVAWLNDWTQFSEIGALLTTSAVPPLRAIGWACQAIVSGPSDLDTARSQFGRAQAELEVALTEDPGLTTDIVAGLIPWVGGRIAADNGDYNMGLCGTQAFLSRSISMDYYTTATPRAAKHAAACQILLGDPAAAIQTVTWLESLDTTTFNGDDIRALAHLALGELSEAEDLIRHHAQRGLAGRLPGEVCDSALLLAALARADGEDELARDILRHMGMGLEPATVVYSRHLADELGVAAQHAERQQLAWSHEGDNPQGPSGTYLAAAAVSSELARRGWT